MDTARLFKIVRQHAESSRLLGVDFVPVFSRGGAVLDLPRAAESPAPAAPEMRTVKKANAEAAPRPAAGGTVSAPTSRSRESVREALDRVLQQYEADAPHKAFKTDHHRIVFDDGDCLARLMFVGEAPGEDEDRVGKPFVGRAGQLLNKMITAMGLTREQVYIANVLKTRPPGNATPTLDECAKCESYLLNQIDIVRPEVIVTLGLTASRVVLRSTATMSSMRGNWHPFCTTGGHELSVMPTFHPAYLLRAYTPENREKVWSDLKQVLAKLGLEAPAAG